MKMKNILVISLLQQFIFGGQLFACGFSATTSTSALPYRSPACLSRGATRECKLNLPASAFGLRFNKRAFGRKYYLHQQQRDDDGSSRHNILDAISYRPVRANDIPECYKIEAASYPEDEAASLENLSDRQQFAGDYFWCATLPTDEARKFNIEHDAETEDIIVGFICSTRCNEFTEESMSTHTASGSILAIHSVVVGSPYRRKGIASAMMQSYLKQVTSFSSIVAETREKGFQRILLLAKSNLLSFYVDNGFMVLRPSPIVHGKETWYELEACQNTLERAIRFQFTCIEDVQDEDVQDASAQPSIANSRPFETSRSTANPDEGLDGNAFAEGRDKRRAKLHSELTKLGMDPHEMEAHPESFGTAAMRTYNSFLLPKSSGALAVAKGPTRPRVVANNISFLVREYKADQEEWLRNVDRNRNTVDSSQGTDNEIDNDKHPITIILDNVRSAHNVGNIIRLAEAAQVDSVRLCGMTPRPPHPKV